VMDIESFFSVILPKSLDRVPATRILLTIALRMTISIELRFKHEFACARPAEYSAQVQPMIRTPGHGTYPMGHSCESFMYAFLLERLIRDQEKIDSKAWLGLSRQLRAVAWRIAENRIIAGVHFPIDLFAGKALAEWIVEYLEYCAFSIESDSFYPLSAQADIPACFSGYTFDPGSVSNENAAQTTLLTKAKIESGKRNTGDIPPNDAWRKIWESARREWGWLNRAS
jgi:hypothetical protein